MKMKAIVVEQHGGPEVMRWQDVDVPEPGPTQVLVRTAATGVNFADIMIREGRYPGGPTPPLIPGLDAAGEVVAAGAAVTRVKPGDRVAVFTMGGAYAAYVLAEEALTYPLPDDVDFETGAAFPTIGITAYNLLTLAGRLNPGETVLVHAAAGGVGTLAVQLAKKLGAGMVIGTVGSDDKAALAKELGCDHVINYRQEDLKARLEAITNGAGVDLILDSVMGDAFDAGLACLAPFGRLIAYGNASGQPGRVATNQLHPSNRAVIGYSSNGYRRARPEALRPAAEAVLELLRKGELRLVIGARYPLKDAAQAHTHVAERRSIGKVLLLP